MIGDIFIRLPNGGQRPQEVEEIGSHDEVSWLSYILTAVSHNAPKSLALIHDAGGMLMTDIEYCRMGVDEGWLRLDGWHRNDKNDIVYRYVMVSEHP